MNVRLVSITPHAEQQILYCARVSSDQESNSTKLLSYLIRKEHWSPFEMAHCVMEIKTSRAIAAQILRHRSFSFQEFSQRYASPEDYERYRARRQAEKNRQSSIDDLDEETTDWFNQLQARIWEDAVAQYELALQKGISRESARFILPLNTQTKMYMAGTIRSWIHYVELRTKPDVQEEHRVVAAMARSILATELPYISEALGWNIALSAT
jgi:thymidylate synthase (FAD)